MALLKIFQYGEPVLRVKAELVVEILDSHLSLAQDMLETMYHAPGIGLAAPQVGESIRLIVVDVSTSKEKDLDLEKRNPFILFNPQILKESKLVHYREGCLSFPGIYADVVRPSVITVSAVNEKREKIILEDIDGILARCILHEIDHLNGILFVDKVSPSDRLLLKNKLKKMSRKQSR